MVKKTSLCWEKTATSQTNFGFTNLGSDVDTFRVTGIWKGKFWFGSPCKNNQYSKSARVQCQSFWHFCLTKIRMVVIFLDLHTVCFAMHHQTSIYHWRSLRHWLDLFSYAYEVEGHMLFLIMHSPRNLIFTCLYLVICASQQSGKIAFFDWRCVLLHYLL